MTPFTVFNATRDLNRFQFKVTMTYGWANEWGMLFISKCVKCVHIQVGKPVPNARLKLGNDIIPTSTSLCYLDIELNPSLKWDG